MSKIFYAMGLHMHQPPANLKLLIDHNEWEAQQIIKCYERAARYAHLFKDAYFHVDFSGILIEQFLDPEIIDRYRRYVDIPQMLELYRTANNIEIIGMGYFHPIFPLIPKDDWDEQLDQGRDLMEKVFRQKTKGFWPSEMAFSMEMIPYLKRCGYEYVIVDHVHVKPDNQKPLDGFKPYIASYEGAEIVIIPRNRDLSNAQESGLNPEWFVSEVTRKLDGCPSHESSRLVTTWSDGENGGWFRQLDENAGFFGYFFAPLVTMMKDKKTKMETIRISDFLKKFKKFDKVQVQTGAWNVGSTSGYNFDQWSGSESQKKAINALFETSKRYWELKNSRSSRISADRLSQARRLILDAETSCYLFWGEAWLPKIYEKLDAVNALLK